MAFRASTQVIVSATSVVATEPAGTVNGDLLIAFVLAGQSTASAPAIVAPAGWTQIVAQAGISGGASSNPSAAVYFQKRSGTPNLTFTCALGTGPYMEAHILSYNQPDWDGYAPQFTQSATGAVVGIINPPAIIPATLPSLLIAGGIAWVGSTTTNWAPPAGYTIRSVLTLGQDGALAERTVIPPAGVSEDPGNFTTTTSTSDAGWSFTLSFNKTAVRPDAGWRSPAVLPGQQPTVQQLPQATRYPPIGAAPLLDDFNRANQNPLASGWANMWSSTNVAQVLSNQLASTGTWAASYWSLQKFQDVEVSLVVATKPIDGSYVDVAARVTDITLAGQTAYTFECDVVAGTDTWTLGKHVNGGAFTAIGNTATREMVSGDRIGMTIIGDKLTGWVVPNGQTLPVILCTATDASITAPGFVGCECNDGTFRGDDFRMAPYVPLPPNPILSMLEAGGWQAAIARQLITVVQPVVVATGAVTLVLDSPTIVFSAANTVVQAPVKMALDTPAIVFNAGNTTVQVPVLMTLDSPGIVFNAANATVKVPVLMVLDTPTILFSTNTSTVSVKVTLTLDTPTIVFNAANVNAVVPVKLNPDTPAIVFNAGQISPVVSVKMTLDTPTIVFNAQAAQVTVPGLNMVLDTPAIVLNSANTVVTAPTKLALDTPAVVFNAGAATVTVKPTLSLDTPAIVFNASNTQVTVKPTLQLDTPAVTVTTSGINVKVPVNLAMGGASITFSEVALVFAKANIAMGPATIVFSEVLNVSYPGGSAVITARLPLQGVGQ